MLFHFRLSKSKLFFCFLIFFSFTAFSQLPKGLIVDPSSSLSGRKILDPNLDGWISATGAAFISQDSSESEIIFKKLIPFNGEPNSDLGAGPNCGYTDYVFSTTPGLTTAIGMYLDANNNWIFRLRLSRLLPNSKSYSVLIDTDGKIGSSGPNADPDYCIGNPGFEIELLLSTANPGGMYVYDVNNNTLTSTQKVLYVGHTNYQRSIAKSTECGDEDAFLDFYIPFSDLIYSGSGISSTSTPLRFAITDNMSANQSTIGHLSNISDLWGTNKTNELGLIEVIEAFTPTCASCTPGKVRTSCPTITTQVGIGATSVSGTGTNGDTIKLYKLHNATTRIPNTSTYAIVSGGTWTISGLTGIIAGDTIGATATGVGKAESINNCDLTPVQACGVVAPLSSGFISANGKGICGAAGAGINNALIQVYQNGARIYPTQGISADTNTVINDGSFQWKANASESNCNSGSNILSGNGLVTQVVNGCESAPICVNFSGSSTQTTAPAITTNPIINGTTPIAGTCVSGARIYLYADGVQIGTVVGTTTWSITPSPTILTGQVITAKAQLGTTQCLSDASTSRTATRISVAPAITSTSCGSSVVSGTSTEATGTRIRLYKNGTIMNAGAGDSTTVSADGTWTTTVATSLANNDVITARTRITGGTLSVASAGVTYKSQTSIGSLTLTNPITDAATSVGGNVTAGQTVSLYIDGFLETTTVGSGGTWSITGLTLFDGNVLKVTTTSGSSCESNPTSNVTVTCVTPSDPAVTSAVSTCQGSVATGIVITSSQIGVIYALYDGSTPFGTAVVGTGGSVELSSGIITSSKTLTVKAFKAGSSCTRDLSQSVSVTMLAADSTWRGVVSTNWFDPRNWCLGGNIPTATTKVKILSSGTYMPVIDAANAVCDTMIIYSGSTVTTSGSFNLDVYGSWINNGGTFTANSGTVSFKGTEAIYIGGTDSTTFNSITVNLTGTTGNDSILLKQPTTMTGLLTLTDGRINTTTTNILNLTSTASSIGGNDTLTISFVDGPMTKAGTTAFTFPVGDGTLYAPIATGTPTSSTTFRAQYFETAYTNTTSMASSPTPVLGGVSLTEYWQLDRTAGSGDATVRLYWDNTNNGSSISSCPDLRVGYYNGSDWTNPSDSCTVLGTGCPSPTGAGTIETDNNLTSFGTFTFGTLGAAPLPVKLIAFNGKCKEKDVVLKWTTASELNNDYFTLERGTNGTDVKPIATIKGSGTSNQLLNYQFIDTRAIGENKPEAVLFYRLKQTDFDGKFEYSNFITVKNCNDNPQEIVLYPNVSSGTVQLNNHEIVTSIEVYNSLGGLVYASEISNPKAEIFLDLPIGMYYYFLKNEDELVGKGKLMIK